MKFGNIKDMAKDKLASKAGEKDKEDKPTDMTDESLDAPEPMEDMGGADDTSDEPSMTAGSDEAAEAAGTDGAPGSLIAEKLGVSPEEGKELLDAAMAMPQYADMPEAELADLMDQDIQVHMRIEKARADKAKKKSRDERDAADMAEMSGMSGGMGGPSGGPMGGEPGDGPAGMM